MSSRACHSARTAASARRPRTRCSPDVRRHGSGRGSAAGIATRWANSCCAHSHLPASTSSACSASRSSTSGSTSRAAYSSHGLGQRAGRPVHRRVLLAEPAAEELLDQGGQADAGVAQQPAGELGVEQGGRAQPQLGQAGQVLRRGVQDPLGALERLRQRVEVVEGDRVDQCGARRPRGAAGPGRRGRSSGSRRLARRRSRPARCRRRSPAATSSSRPRW